MKLTEKELFESYREIKAPKSLREKVENTEAEIMLSRSIRKQKLLRGTLSAVAACFLIAVVLTVFLQGRIKEPVLLYGETKIGTEPVSISTEEEAAVAFAMKSISQSGIPFEIKTGRDSKVSVSDGILLIYDSNELVSVVTDVTVSKDTLVKWDVSEITVFPSTLSVESGKTTYVYTLNFEEEGYTVSLIGSE